MNRLTYIIIGALLVSLTGCITVEKVVRERVDQDISGNRGYLQGAASDVAKESKPEKREYIDVKLELPTFGEIKKRLPRAKTRVKRKERTEDKAVAGNQGYLSRGADFEEELPPVRREEPRHATVGRVVDPATVYEEVEEEIMEEDVYAPEPAVAMQTYKVKSGDTLSQISKDIYGKASKWTIIYEANAGKIKDPNRIREGVLLDIPALEEVESEYTK